MAPQGQLSLAGTETAVVLGDGTGVLGPAMGDAARRLPLSTVILDGYDRAYSANLAAGIGNARLDPKLYDAVSGRTQGLDVKAGETSIAFTVDPGSVRAAQPVPLRLDDEHAEKARLLAARIATRIAPNTQLAFALRQGAQGLEASLAGKVRPAFLLAGEGGSNLGFTARGDGAVAVRHAMGPLGLTVSAETGDVWTDRIAHDGFDRGQQAGFARYGGALDWSRGAVDLAVGASWLAEDETVLGARFADSIGAGGAESLFFDATAGWQPAPGWSLTADYRRGFTMPQAAGMVESGSRFQSSAWSVDAQKVGVLLRGDALGLRIAQPLRVENGGIALTLPTGWDYATETATFGRRTLSLTPSGREIDGEVRWTGPWMGGNLTASLFYRRDPGHVASIADDKGAALRWYAKF
ncbi:hypothetical protein [Croceicoccus naphthovorans]|uniref:hypothetical protein n=1 Tax=Croceicoccus naphthovorans TaxID=1348774 RepID=UPI00069DE012|nr:hypothetical protein [Croceicoccus naphthovorans]MBB3991266.1 hypothetical protein [Croceicoccus naphthovorans]